MFKTPVVSRTEKRVPMAVAVRIAGHPALPGVETTFTEDVSSRGAKVYSARRWKADERLQMATLTGNFQSVARVAWCQQSREVGFAVGVEFLERSGEWVVAPRVIASDAMAS